MPVLGIIVLLASGTSVLAGLPGGIAMAITIPADVAQFYGFSLKLAQELGYIYGYEDLWASRDELSEDAQNTLLLYLGVMLGGEWNRCLATCRWYNNCQTGNENST